MSSKKEPRHLLSLNSEEKQAFLDSFDYVLSDIDGVVWVMDHIIEGAGEGFQVLVKAGKNLTFITNNSVRPVDDCEKRFKALGLDIKKEDIWHPAKSTVKYLKSINFDGLLYVLCSKYFQQVLHEAGFKFIEGPTEIIEESVRVLLEKAIDDQPVRAVVFDIDINLTQTKLIRAQMYLRHPECIFIAGSTDGYLQLRKDFRIIGPGFYAEVLQKASGKPMIEVGKPGKELVEMLLNHLQVKDKRRVLMIGDLLGQDVAFAKRCGLQSVFVLSGINTLEEMKAETNPDLIPDYYADSVADFVKFMEDLKN